MSRPFTTPLQCIRGQHEELDLNLITKSNNKSNEHGLKIVYRLLDFNLQCATYNNISVQIHFWASSNQIAELQSKLSPIMTYVIGPPHKPSLYMVAWWVEFKEL